MRSSVAPRGLSLISMLMLIVATLLIGTALTIGTLWALGVDLPFLSSKAPALFVAKREGFPVPILAQPLPAYTRIKLDHFFDAKTGEPRYYYAKSEAELVRLKFIKNPAEIVNRVLARDKPAGYPFVEEDFEQKGTRPGEVAGIPAGKRGFVLPADKVQGIHGLKLGDRFDLVGSVPVETKAPVKITTVGSPDAAMIEGTSKHAKVRVLVQNGSVIVPVVIREIPTGSPSMAKGGNPPSKPVQEVHIAIDPAEVAPLLEALSTNATLICVARSGRPDDAKIRSVITGSSPPPPIHALETIVGGKRQIVVFPSTGKGPEFVGQ